jgi:hypothetical protein
MADYGLRMTAAEAERLVRDIDALVRLYIGATRDDAPRGAEAVHLSFRAFKRP